MSSAISQVMNVGGALLGPAKDPSAAAAKQQAAVLEQQAAAQRQEAERRAQILGQQRETQRRASSRDFAARLARARVSGASDAALDQNVDIYGMQQRQDDLDTQAQAQDLLHSGAYAANRLQNQSAQLAAKQSSAGGGGLGSLLAGGAKAYSALNATANLAGEAGSLLLL
jgi:hypothetical protein